MGLTTVEATVANPFQPERQTTLAFLVDSGAVYTVIPRAVLESLGITPTGERTFYLANGALIRRKMGEARITFRGESATCVVLFGEEGDNNLLGVTTLENLGLIFDPLRQEIMPLPMLLSHTEQQLRVVL